MYGRQGTPKLDGLSNNISTCSDCRVEGVSRPLCRGVEGGGGALGNKTTYTETRWGLLEG